MRITMVEIMVSRKGWYYIINWYSKGIYEFRDKIINSLKILMEFKGIYEKKIQWRWQIYWTMAGVFLDQRQVRKAIRDRYVKCGRSKVCLLWWFDIKRQGAICNRLNHAIYKIGKKVTIIIGELNLFKIMGIYRHIGGGVKDESSCNSRKFKKRVIQ